MTDLIVCVSTGKGTWKEVTSLMNQGPWGKILVVTNHFGKENFSSLPKNAEVLVFDFEQDIKSLSLEIGKVIKQKIKNLEVAVNFVSGAGKEHMALMAALIKAGAGVRLITAGKSAPEEL
ncbi:MAG: hypothetical protein Q7R56_00950 [Nanoarchaeota archaeon]|nr:hypothetical protein [Nanoarchaeota archaeon]